MNRIDRNNFFKLLRVASRFESKLRKKRNNKQYNFLIKNYIWIFQIFPFIIAIIIGGSLSYLEEPKFYRSAGLILLLIVYLSTLMHPFIIAWKNRMVISETLKEPFWILLKNAQETTNVDTHILRRLKCYSIENLEFLIVELKSEKEFFERRISLVVGAIDKVGLFPGLLALSVKFFDTQGNTPDLWMALVYATPILYFIGIYAHFLLMQLDRYIKIIELALVHKKH